MFFLKRLFSLLFLLGLAIPASPLAVFAESPDDDVPIYVTMVTHNEQPDSGRYPDFVADEDAFWQYRDALVAYGNMLAEENVSYNFQPAWTFLLATLTYDKGTSSTNGKNVVRYLVEDLGFSVNVHGHEDETYSYGDAAYLIDALGVEPTGIMGGFVATPAEDSELENLWLPQKGDAYDYTWQPTALWGAASRGHTNDGPVEISGIWNPVSAEDFFSHRDAAPLPVIGTYTSDWNGLEELLDKQAEGALDPEVMHTASIMVNHDAFLTSAQRESVRTHLEALQDEVAEGRIVWMNLEEVLSTWETEYGKVPSLFKRTSTSYESFISSGDLIKTPCVGSTDVNDPCRAVYYYDAEQKRRAFPNEKAFSTWYENFDGVVTVTAGTMSDISLGKNVTYKPGVKMVKFPSVPSVYAVSAGGVLRKITSESVAAALYGSHWNQQIDDISEAFYSNYIFGEDIDSANDYDPEEEEQNAGTIDDLVEVPDAVSAADINWESDDLTAATFTLNTQDFAYPEKSAETVERVLDIHDAYDVPVDVYLTTTMVDIFSEDYPDLFHRLQDESFVTLSYHIRPPVPYQVEDFDYMGLAEMSDADQYDVVMEYETHGLNLETGEPTTAEGSYAYFKELIGYAPYAVGAAALAGLGDEVQDVFRDLGATFLVENGRGVDLGETRNGLFLRPQHVDVKIFQYDETDGEAILDDLLEEEESISHDGPFFLGFKMHDNDFFAEKSAWTTVYFAPGAHAAGPPFDISLKADLLSEGAAEIMWARYESVVAAVAQSDVVTTNMRELAEVLE